MGIPWKGTVQPPAKKAKTEEDKRIKQQQYDSNKRVRTFQPSWKAVYKWMSYDNNKMFCTVCCALETLGLGTFIKESDNFKLESIQTHDFLRDTRKTNPPST